MKIGGMARDGVMTLIPLAVAIVVATFLLGGPEEGLRAIETGAQRAWATVAVWFRH